MSWGGVGNVADLEGRLTWIRKFLRDRDTSEDSTAVLLVSAAGLDAVERAAGSVSAFFAERAPDLSFSSWMPWGRGRALCEERGNGYYSSGGWSWRADPGHMLFTCACGRHDRVRNDDGPDVEAWAMRALKHELAAKPGCATQNWGHVPKRVPRTKGGRFDTPNATG